jgi:hypothetical protein
MDAYITSVDAVTVYNHRLYKYTVKFQFWQALNEIALNEIDAKHRHQDAEKQCSVCESVNDHQKITFKPMHSDPAGSDVEDDSEVVSQGALDRQYLG